MKVLFCTLITFALSQGIFAQNTFKAIVKDNTTHEALIGATVVIKQLKAGTMSNAEGLVTIPNLPAGEHLVLFSMIGYESLSLKINLPSSNDSIMLLFMEPSTEELEEVEVSATRSSRMINDIPTRVETISAGELAEKAVMQSANIKMVLTESTGIQTQQTSAISANTSIRIQGLDGKYTQLLKDGFPLYAGFSGGLSIMQIPPLDLKRAEVIKGSASTLYGGGAIAGLVNLVTKEPGEKPEFTFMTNLTSANGLDLNTFYSQKFEKTGFTIFASRNAQKAYDPNNDGFTDIPQNTLYNFNPKLYYYFNRNSTLMVGLNTSNENRLGGDMLVINNKGSAAHSFYQRNKSSRYSTQLKYNHKRDNNQELTIKNSLGYFSRDIEMPLYNFGGKQTSAYSEISFLIPGERSEWITGLNHWADIFKEKRYSFDVKRDYKQNTAGAFVQNNLKVNEKIILESGLRVDYLMLQSVGNMSQNYAFVLPRLSLMYKFSPKLTSRMGGGLGYKAPGIFAEEAETQGFRNVLPINLNDVKPEKSAGINLDINYKTVLFDELSFTFNHMFFYTQLNNPVVANESLLSRDTLSYENASGNISSKGFETNLKLTYNHFSVYIGYTFIDALRDYNGKKLANPLTAKNRLYFTTMYEVEDKIRIGYEVFYVSPQHLTSGQYVRDYWLMGFSAEKYFKFFTLFVNFENILDSRQSRWQPMVTGSVSNPQFSEVWAPTDGFIFNGGFRIIL